MAKVKLNPVIMQVRGQIGDLVFKRYEDRVILGRKNDLSDVKPNEAQLEHQERFRQAALYGKLVMADPAQKADYQAAAKALGKPVFSLTVADFFNAPSVDEVDVSTYGGAAGDEIVIRAHDDFEVSAAQVEITCVDGQPARRKRRCRGDARQKRTLGLYGHQRRSPGHGRAHRCDRQRPPRRQRPGDGGEVVQVSCKQNRQSRIRQRAGLSCFLFNGECARCHS
jgi:hypothetical protein